MNLKISIYTLNHKTKIDRNSTIEEKLLKMNYMAFLLQQEHLSLSTTSLLNHSLKSFTIDTAQ